MAPDEPQSPSSTRGANQALLPPLALLVACAVDLAVVGLRPTTRFLIVLGSLALFWGSVAGLAWQLLRCGLGRLGRAPRAAVAIGICVALGAVFAHRLGAFRLLDDRRWAIALVAIIGCVLGAATVGTALFVTTPDARRPHGPLASLPGRWRFLAFALCLYAAAALAWLDYTTFRDAYAPAHTLLKIGVIVALVVAFAAARLERRLPRYGGRIGVAGATAGAILALATLGPEDVTAQVKLSEHPWGQLLLDGSRRLLDRDGDGHAALLGGGDCNDFDPDIHPGAPEVAANGIDDNCLFGDAKPPAVRPSFPPPPVEAAPLDLVLITIDALRADRMSLYRGGVAGRQTTPNIDAWAKRATVFERAYAPGSRTGVTIPAMMTGLYARRLRWSRQLVPLTGEPRHWLAVRLGERGMRTVAIVNDGPSDYLAPSRPVARGFEVYRRDDDLEQDERDDAGIVDAALAAMESSSDSERLFLWVHLYELHVPVEVEGPSRFGPTDMDLYDHEVHRIDRRIGRLLRGLATRRPGAAVFVTADHGEQVTRGRRLHGYDVHLGVVHVPLLARVPGWPEGRIDTPVSLVDIAPTLLALAALSEAPLTDGLDLAPIARGRSLPDRIVLSDAFLYRPEIGLTHDWMGATSRSRHVEWDRIRNIVTEQRLSDPLTPRRTVIHPAAWRSDPLVLALLRYAEESGGLF